MKKLIKCLGLLLLAVAMMTGCKGGPDNDDATIPATEIKFSDGTWEMKEKIDCHSEVASLKLDQSYTYVISGDNVTVTAGSISMNQTITYPASYSDDEVASMRTNLQGMFQIFSFDTTKRYEVGGSGKTITLSISGTRSEDEIDNENISTSEIADLTIGLPADCTIMTNENNTVYKVTWEGDYEGEYSDYAGGGAGDFTGSFSIIFKKK